MTADAVSDTPTDRPILGQRVADVMSPGCVSVPADAPVATAVAALGAHDVHAVLVVDPKTCAPLGWITARGIVRGAAEGMQKGLAEGLIDEQVTAIDRNRSAKVARFALSLDGVSRLLVRSAGAAAPEGVVTERDIAHATLGSARDQD